jgi:hypothetical protein
MTPHTSGTSLSAQARYAAGVREILECWFEGRPIREDYLIVDGGRLAGPGRMPIARATRPVAQTKRPGSTTDRALRTVALSVRRWHQGWYASGP